MTFDFEYLSRMIQENKKILVRSDDGFDFPEVPDVITLGFIVASTVEVCLNPENEEACLIDGNVLNEALFRFCYTYNEGDENNFSLTLKKEHIERFMETYLFVRTGSDECQKDFLETVKKACLDNCMNTWSTYFN